MNDKKNIKTIVIGIGALLFALYRFGTPFLEETSKRKKQADELKASIQVVQSESASYGKAWEDNINKQEEKFIKKLPETLPSSEVLNYFLTQFEQKHPGQVSFSNVDYQKVSLSDINANNARARTMRYKIRAEIAQNRFIDFMDHIERYSSLVHILNFGIAWVANRQNSLDLDLSFDLWLMPKEWVTPGKAIAQNEDPSENEPDKTKSEKWTNAFGNDAGREVASTTSSSNNSEKTEKKSGISRVDAIIGNAIVIDENIYEEGESISGWMILKVDPNKKVVTFRSGNTTKELTVK